MICFIKINLILCQAIQVKISQCDVVEQATKYCAILCATRLSLDEQGNTMRQVSARALSTYRSATKQVNCTAGMVGLEILLI